MGNIKRVSISGKLPYHMDEYNCEMMVWLGHFNLPTSGLKIQWGASNLVLNEGKGRTTMYKFTIAGETSMWWANLYDMVNCLIRTGTVDKATAKDIEDDSPEHPSHWIDLLVG